MIPKQSTSNTKSPLSTIEEIPSWVDAKEDQRSTGALSSLTKTGNLDLKDSKSSAPLTVCVHEWVIEKSNPVSLMPRKKWALVRIELRRNPNLGLGLNGYRDLELGSEPSDWSALIQPGDDVVFHLFKKKTTQDEEPDVTENQSVASGSTVSTMGLEGVDINFMNALANVQDGHEWKVKLSVPLEKVILKLDGAKVLAEFDMGKRKKRILLHFPTKKQSTHFFMFIKTLKINLRQAAMSSVQMELGGFVPSNLSTPIQFLVEIISATDLKAVNRDRDTSDPFVIVKYGGEQIHTTSVIHKNLDPIWTVRTKSLFTFSLHPDDFYSHDDMIFEVKDKAILTKEKCLGQAMFPIKKLIECKGERHAIKLQYIQTGESAQGYLAIRCKRATASEIEFVENIEAEEFLTKEYYNDLVTAKVGQQKSLPSLRKKRIGNDIYYLARPIQQDKGEQWMTSNQIEYLANSPSQFWTEIGGGKLGQLYVEVIGIDRLINLDRASLIPGDTTDAYVTCAFEDAAITTDVIKDRKSPRFLPWTRRAFKFNINHISSNLFIGCFDHDMGDNPDDPIGRLNIPLGRFVPNTTYNLSYKLYDTDQVSNRSPRGTIHLRMRIEHTNHRGIFFNALQSPSSKYTIHFDNKQNYRHAEYAVKGYADIEEYDLRTFFSFLNEIMEYQSIPFTVTEFFKTLWLWRGHWKLTFCGWHVYIPLHSMLAFTFAIIIAERPQYILSCFFASIAWAMMALLELERKRPSSWGKPPSYFSLLARLITGRAPPETIEEDEHEDAESAYLKNSKAKAEANGVASDKFWQDYTKEIEEWEEINAESIRIHRRRNKSNRFDLFKNTLFPMQKFLYDVILKLRFVSSILKWDQMYTSFWITTIAILLSVMSLYIAKHFLFLKRIVLYTAFGPWNKMFDVLNFKKFDSFTDEKMEELEREKTREHHNRFRDSFLAAQQRREDRDKKEAIKQLMFGEDGVILPDLFTPEKYYSVPTISSSAFPNKSDPEDDFRNCSRQLKHMGQR